MAKSWVCVPGLAKTETPSQHVLDRDGFRAKVNSAFGADIYLRDMAKVLLGKGATPVDCNQAICWLEIQCFGLPINKGLLRLLGDGNHAAQDDVLSRRAGVQPVAITMTFGDVAVACTAPE